MLHRVRSAVLRSSGARTRAESPADRLTGLLVPAGGWLPPAAEELQAWAPDGAEAPAGWPDDQPDRELDQTSADDPVGAAPPARSWSPVGRHASDGPPQRWRLAWRLDLGRSAVGALLLVAALAALLAGGVVLRGRPQEVVAPVVEATAVSAPAGGPGAEAGAGSTGAGSAGAGTGGAGPAVEATGVPLPGASTGSRPAAPGEVVVAVAGKVRTPGLVRLPAGSRVDDALRAAGGPVDPADVGLLNLARVLADGEQVLVGVEPPPGAAPPAGGAGGVTGAPAVAGALLDLNAASASDLDGLPGIGPVLAQRIVDWRTEHGRFASVDQLREVTGIGEAKYQDLVEKVVV